MNPITIRRYYQEKGYEVDLYINPRNVPKTYDAYIMFYAYLDSNKEGIPFGAHYIAIEYDDQTGQLIGYNNNRKNTTEKSLTFSGFLPDWKLLPFVWGINKPDECYTQEPLSGAYAK